MYVCNTTEQEAWLTGRIVLSIFWKSIPLPELISSPLSILSWSLQKISGRQPSSSAMIFCDSNGEKDDRHLTGRGDS
jgi:hypothetical protein